MGDWIPIKFRPMTEEERAYVNEYSDFTLRDETMMLDCPLPDDGQEVIVSVRGRERSWVELDIFERDSAYMCGFESNDISDIEAWQPLPEPYKAESLED